MLAVIRAFVAVSVLQIRFAMDAVVFQYCAFTAWLKSWSKPRKTILSPVFRAANELTGGNTPFLCLRTHLSLLHNQDIYMLQVYCKEKIAVFDIQIKAANVCVEEPVEGVSLPSLCPLYYRVTSTSNIPLPSTLEVTVYFRFRANQTE